MSLIPYLTSSRMWMQTGAVRLSRACMGAQDELRRARVASASEDSVTRLTRMTPSLMD